MRKAAINTRSEVNDRPALTQETSLPAEPSDRILNPIARFLHIEPTGSVGLLLAASVAFVLANALLYPTLSFIMKDARRLFGRRI